MITSFRIIDWSEKYEVDSRGNAAGAGAQLRYGPLKFVRLKVFGKKVGLSYTRMRRKADKYGVGFGIAALGLFAKLLEVAGDQIAPYRGWILDEKQIPMTAEDIADLVTEDVDVIKRLLEVLADPRVGWIDEVEFPGADALKEQFSRETPGNPGNSREIPDPLYNETKRKHNTTQHNETTTPPAIAGGPVSENPDSLSMKFRFDSNSSRMILDLNAIRSIESQFPNRSDSDDVVIRDVIRGARAEDLDAIVTAAAESRLDSQNPIAKWVDTCKRLYGYVPKGRKSNQARKFKGDLVQAG